MSNTTCPGSGGMGCSFSNGLCGYRQEEEDDDLDWIWHEGFGTDDPFLPNESKKHGYYMYLNTSAKPESTGILYTTAELVLRQRCMSFFAHMHAIGGNSAHLEIYAESGGTKKLLKRITSDLGPDWSMVQVPIPSQVFPPQRIMFKGTIKEARNATMSTLAIDDIKFTQGACDAPGSCVFDGRTCSWSSSETHGEVQWQLSNPNAVSLETKPWLDRTFWDHSGGFMFIEADPSLKSKKAWLMSDKQPRLYPSENCVTFWYHLYGMEGTSLSVMQYNPANGKATSLWIQNPELPIWYQYWAYGTAPYSSNQPYQLVFEAVLGDGVMGDVAIDDVFI
ncbi:unnamed protein product, partial [Meganyctiphanes norvegica]